MNTNKKIGFGVVGLLVAVGIFFGGVKYGEAKTSGARTAAYGAASGQFARNGQSGTASVGGTRTGAGARTGGMGANMGGLINGEVLSKDDKSVTIKLPTGGSQIILTASSTQVFKSETGSVSDVPVGSTIAVQGTTNSDGSVTAKLIQLRPATSTQPTR